GIIEKTKQENQKLISGKDAFTLYDTYGFPLELSVEIASEENIEIDIEGFQKHMQEQKERAKKAHVTERLTDDLVYAEILKELGPTKFTGYNETITKDCKVLKLIKDGKITELAQSGDLVEVILDQTPYYAESGGQVGDTGILKSDNLLLDVINTTKYEDLHIHRCEVNEGEITLNLMLNAEVDPKRRKDIACHHTATHLIHSALKKVLGDDVNQSGSMVAPDRARFDFSYPKALKFEQLKEIEKWVNIWIEEDMKNKTEQMRPEEAKSSGAIALFGEKYGETVRVVSYGAISKELCGGTHISNTGQIHLCKIVSEEALAAGIRRLEAVCGKYALELVNEYEKQVHNLTLSLKVPAEELTERIDKMLDEMKSTEKKLQAINSELAMTKVDSLLENVRRINDFKLLSGRVDNLDSRALKSAADKLNDKLGKSIIVLGSVDNETDKVTIVVKVSDSLIKEGYKAGDIANKVASICGGRGGGKPNFAQAGAKEPSKLNEALDAINNIVSELVKA
ncbi:MAG: alanine--tRNA ligase, partial [Cyanobacteriota bacterium]